MYHPNKPTYTAWDAYTKDMDELKTEKLMMRIPLTKKQIMMKKMYQYLYEFCFLSNFHGCKQLAARRRHWVEYVLWSATLLAAIGMTLYVSSFSWMRYQHFPTVIVMEKNNKEWNITFPTAIICPEQKLSMKKLRQLADEYKVKDKDAFVEFFDQLSKADFESFGRLPDYTEISPNQFLKIITQAAGNFTHQVDTTLTLETERMDPIFTEFGVCYSYNSKIAPYFNPLVITGVKKAKEGTQELYYCDALDADTFTAVHGMDTGYSGCVSGPFDIPSVGTSFLKSKTFTFRDLDVACLPIVSTDDVRELAVEQRRCRTRSDNNLRISHIYSYNLCRMECRMNLGFKLCNCIPYIYVNEDVRTFDVKLPICDVKGMKCLSESESILNELMDPITKEKVPCNCLPLCTDYHYRIREDILMEWEDTRFRWQMKTFPPARYKRSIIFGFTDFIVGIGATAGLFLGCSVLSFVEMFYFFSIRLFFILIKKRREKATGQGKRKKPTRLNKFSEFLN